MFHYQSLTYVCLRYLRKNGKVGKVSGLGSMYQDNRGVGLFPVSR